MKLYPPPGWKHIKPLFVNVHVVIHLVEHTILVNVLKCKLHAFNLVDLVQVRFHIDKCIFYCAMFD